MIVDQVELLAFRAQALTNRIIALQYSEDYTLAEEEKAYLQDLQSFLDEALTNMLNITSGIQLRHELSSLSTKLEEIVQL